MAVNIAPGYTDEEWETWWYQYTDQPVTFAQDTSGEAVRAYQIRSLGVKVIVDRDGQIVHRSAGITGYKDLRAVIEKAL